MDNLEIRSKLEVILGLLSTAMNRAEELHSELEPRESDSNLEPIGSDSNIYIRAFKRLNPDAFHEIAEWKELEGSPGLGVTLRDGRKALITFSVDLENYHVIVDGRL